MELNLEPVKVDLQIETPSLERGAFYSLCFITENDEAPRTLEVNTLSDLLDNGYVREDLAYNFCLGVFAQQGIESVYIRAKRSYETYEEAFSSDSNDDYYYLVIESKDSQVISDFNDFVVSSDDYKLQFYSSNEEPIEGRKLVHYFFDRGSDKNDFYLSKVMGEPDYIEESPSPEEPEEPEDPDIEDAFTFTVQFPEGGDVGVVLLNAKQPWIFKDADTGVILADSFGIVGDNVSIMQDLESSETAVFVDVLDSAKRTFSLIAECDAVLLGSSVRDAEGTGARGNLVEVLNYHSHISSYGYRFNGVELRVPNFLPRNVTSTNSMFEGCWNFNQDISSWDVSNVTSMAGMFSSALTFNQPLNSWDVSNVTDMSYMFNSNEFDQPLGLWDVSNVTNMESMFSRSNMSQDLSGWCVANIPSYPQSFASFSPLEDLPEFHPRWGTCPRGENGEIDEEIGDIYEGDEPVRITYDATDVYPNSTVFKIYISDAYKKWEIRKLGEVVFNSDMTSPNFTLVANSDDNTNIQLVNFEGGVDSLEIYSKGEMVTVEVTSNLGRATSPEITVESFGSVIQRMSFDTKDCPITLPVELPPNITSLKNMFYNCGGYISDITSWDTTNIVSMESTFSGNSSFNQDISNWNTENVLSMRTAFYNCTSFNQDLSSWCVTKIPVEPDYFDLLASSWTLPRPVWGTCPAPVRLDPYDPNYQPIPRMAAMFIQDEETLSPVELQQQRLAYPEGAWIGSCGDSFPSRVNWLHKYLSKVDVRKRDATSKVPPLSTTTAEVMKRRATVGSGLTTQGIVIHEQVSLDWIKWALGRKVWKTLYNNERINATSGGLDLVVNDVKEVLNLAIEEEMLSEYRITEVLFDRHSNNLSLKFSCKLMETILFVDISGSLYY